MRIFIFLLLTVIIFLTKSNAFAYKERIHHTATENAVTSSSVLGFMMSYLDIAPDIDLNIEFSDKSAPVWITYGATEEDTFPRYENHFFDPTTENGIYIPGFGQQNSSRTWGKNLSLNNWDWESAREYYHLALKPLKHSLFVGLFTSCTS